MVDDIMDNDGYARLFGAEKARHDAGELIKKAKEAIRPFGKRAGVLSALADYVMDQAG
jgi:hypothetical protein